MRKRHPTRRQFLTYGSMLIAGAVGSVNVAAKPRRRRRGRKIRRVYRYSCRGRRCSQFAKIYAANKRFPTKGTAKRYPPHPGHHARIVSIVVSDEQFVAWFRRGKRLRNVVDLRYV